MAVEIADPLLNEKQLAAWLGVSLPSLHRLRSAGNGPPFVQLSARRIGYRRSAVERWLEARTVTRIGSLATRQRRPGATADERVSA